MHEKYQKYLKYLATDREGSGYLGKHTAFMTQTWMSWRGQVKGKEQKVGRACLAMGLVGHFGPCSPVRGTGQEHLVMRFTFTRLVQAIFRLGTGNKAD